MRKQLFLLLTFIPFLSGAQVVASFDSLTLPKNDTFYVNYSNPGQDVGFTSGLMHFPCIYDTSFGGLWSTGFAYSNMTDSATPGFTNMYSAKAGIGYNGSANYNVYQQGYGPDNYVKEIGGTWFIPSGLYVTNSTYAYNAMRDGYFNAKKFGGITGNDTDWFKLVIYGYHNGVKKPDSVAFYLADYRFTDNTQDYLIKDWTWVDLHSLGVVDSLKFMLSSSDTGQFGMNTPAYFCLDNMVNNIPIVGVNEVPANAIAKIYPNPATDIVTVAVSEHSIQTVCLLDMYGRLLQQKPAQAKTIFSVAALPAGIYIVQLKSSTGQMTSVQIHKQ